MMRSADDEFYNIDEESFSEIVRFFNDELDIYRIDTPNSGFVHYVEFALMLLENFKAYSDLT